MDARTNQPVIDVIMEDILYEFHSEWNWKVGSNPFNIQFYNKDVLEIVVLGQSARVCATRLGIKEK